MRRMKFSGTTPLMFLLTITIFSLMLMLPLAEAETWIEVAKWSGSAFPNPVSLTEEVEIDYANWRIRWSYTAVGYPFETLLLVVVDGEMLVYSSNYIDWSGIREIHGAPGKFNFSITVANAYEYTIIIEQDVDSEYARTICIRADGSIDPPTAPIATTDNISYVLTNDIYDWRIVVKRDNITIDGKGHTIQGRGDYLSKGIDISGMKNVTIQNIRIEDFFFGIYLKSGSLNCICKNIIENITSSAIFILTSSGNNISGNNITRNGYGLILSDSSNNIIKNNAIVANSKSGIWLMGSSDYNNVSQNSIANNNIGISLAGCSAKNNIIYHNNFIDNNDQAVPSESANLWDNGYPYGGNYWSDHIHVDIKRGPLQDQFGSDGIADQPYIIDEENIDHYPLTYPYGTPPPPKCNLTITITSGGITNPPPGSYSFTTGSTINVTATPNFGYSFKCWLLDGEEKTENPIIITLDGNHTLKAVFVLDVSLALSLIVIPVAVAIFSIVIILRRRKLQRRAKKDSKSFALFSDW